jgi:Bacterial SH3 domain
MKIKAIIILFLIPMVLVAHQSRFSEGETIYVWAMSGLNMRKLPDAKSEKIASLPYGTKVTVQPNIGVIVAHEVEEFKDFKVKGVWLLVKYGDKEGFVFDGYMSRLVAPEYYKKGIVSYFDNKIGNIGEKYDVKEVKSEIDEDNSNSYKQKYQKGIIYEFTSAYETDLEKITLPNLTLFGSDFKCMLLKVYKKGI